MLDYDCALSSVHLSVCLCNWDFAVHMCVCVCVFCFFFCVFVLISALIRVTSHSDSGHTPWPTSKTLNPSKQPKDGLRDYKSSSPSSFCICSNALSIKEQSAIMTLKSPACIQLQLQSKHICCFR